MSIVEIQQMKTTFDFANAHHEGSTAVHESVFKAYHILSKVKYYLEEGVPSHIILELIEEMEYN